MRHLYQLRLGILSFVIFFVAIVSLQAQNQAALGCILDEQKYAAAPNAATLTSKSYERLPSAFSLKKYCPTPGHQGRQTSCSGWATAYARSMMYAVKNGLIGCAKIDQFVHSPSYIYNQIKTHPSCEKGGATIIDALNILIQQGVAQKKRYPYECNLPISRSHQSNAAQYKVSSYQKLDGQNRNIIQLIKKSISAKHPVIIGMNVYQSFYNKMRERTVWQGQQDQFMGAHAMTVVAYDDNKYGGAVQIVNSWGTAWGDDGFCWIRYADLLNNTQEYYEILDPSAPEEEIVVIPPTPVKPKPRPNPTPDPRPAPTNRPSSIKNLFGKIEFIQSNNQLMQARLFHNGQKDVSPNRSKGFDMTPAAQADYELVQPYPSGTKFRLYIDNTKPAYIYLIGFDKTQKVELLYPFKGFTAAIPYENSTVAIPNEQYYITLDEQIGTDYLCVLYSKYPLMIQNIQSQMDRSSGHIMERLNKVLGNRLINTQNVRFSREEIKFSAKASALKDVVALVVEIKHIAQFKLSAPENER